MLLRPVRHVLHMLCGGFTSGTDKPRLQSTGFQAHCLQLMRATRADLASAARAAAHLYPTCGHTRTCAALPCLRRSGGYKHYHSGHAVTVMRSMTMCLCMQPGDRDVAMLLLCLSKPACIDRPASDQACSLATSALR